MSMFTRLLVVFASVVGVLALAGPAIAGSANRLRSTVATAKVVDEGDSRRGRAAPPHRTCRVGAAYRLD
jgi:outer membrane murein-binding lipoprotein Lpp